MMKSDKSIHDVCIASIKRSTIKPYDFRWTKFYVLNSDYEYSYPEIPIKFSENELIICSTIIDSKNFSILTTQRLTTNEGGIINTGSLIEATDKLYGDFKGYEDRAFTFGLVQLKSGADLKYFIETGKASMIMIYGVRTIIRIQKMSNTQIHNLINIWNRENE